MDCRVPDKSLKTVFSFAYAFTFLYICFQNATIMKYPIGIQSFPKCHDYEISYRNPEF